MSGIRFAAEYNCSVRSGQYDTGWAHASSPDRMRLDTRSPRRQSMQRRLHAANVWRCQGIPNAKAAPGGVSCRDMPRRVKLRGLAPQRLDHLQHRKRQGRHAGRLLRLVMRAHPASGGASDAMGCSPRRVDGLMGIVWPARGRGAWGLRAGQRGFPFGSPHHQRAIAWRGGISGLSVTTGAGAPFKHIGPARRPA